MYTDIAHLSPEAQDAILWCTKAGLLRGVGEGKFDPNSPLERWQQAIVTQRTMDFAKIAARKFRRSTVTLFNTTTLKMGAGFFANKQGDILTNQHVVADKDNKPAPVQQLIIADWGPIRSSPLQPIPSIAFDPTDQTDLALIRLHHSMRAELPELTVIPFNEDEPEEGERCVAIGSPLSYANWISEGIVALYPIAVATNPGKWVGVTAGINPGNSGGPVITLDERLLGVATLKPWYNSGWGMAPGDDMGLVFCATEIKKWMDKWGFPVG